MGCSFCYNKEKTVRLNSLTVSFFRITDRPQTQTQSHLRMCSDYAFLAPPAGIEPTTNP